MFMFLFWSIGASGSPDNTGTSQSQDNKQQLRLATVVDIKLAEDKRSLEERFIDAMKMSRTESTQKQAFQQFRDLAEAGHIKSMATLGYSYEKHLGTHVSMLKAQYWYQKAADNGDPQGNWYLYKIYMAGDIVPRDVGKACSELKTALSRHYHRVRQTYTQFCQASTPPG